MRRRATQPGSSNPIGSTPRRGMPDPDDGQPRPGTEGLWVSMTRRRVGHWLDNAGNPQPLVADQP